MAQVDTGLGWSANGDYLGSVGGTPICNFGGLLGGPEVPYAATAQDAIANGFWTLKLVYSNYEIIYYLARNDESASVIVNAYFYQGNNYAAIGYSTTQNTTVTQYEYNTQTGRVTSTRGYALRTEGPGSGVWSGAVGSALWGSDREGNPDITIYSSEQEALAAVSVVSLPIAKLNNGYSVACVLKWKSTTGIIQSPILISSDPDYIKFAYNGTYSEQESSHLWDGMRFYMRYITDLPGSLVSSIVPVIDISTGAIATSDMIFRGIAGPSYANILLTGTPPDPYEQQTDPSEEEGGDGHDPEDDPVDEETLPIPAVVGLGFSTIYVPTQSDLYNLAAYLWGGNLDLDNFLKLFANPMDSILGLSAVPLVLSGTYEPIYLGGQLLQGITMPRYAGRTAVKVDMGTATISERWGSYLDYDPYTELAVYVPFVGIKNIKADDVMGKTVRLMYDIDILSGACIAYIRPEGGSPLYEWSGQCAMQIPITGANWDNIFNSAIHTVATLGGALFAPASAPVLGGAVASAASQAIAAKPRIERSGAMNGVTGFLGQLRPYIIRTIPEAYIPNDQNKFIGYPSYVSVNLGSLTGYNEIASIHLENIPATGDELSELESILKGGAIF